MVADKGKEFKWRSQEPESRSQEAPAVERASLARPWRTGRFGYARRGIVYALYGVA
jgi:hypothetical protein